MSKVKTKVVHKAAEEPPPTCHISKEHSDGSGRVDQTDKVAAGAGAVCAGRRFHPEGHSTVSSRERARQDQLLADFTASAQLLGSPSASAQDRANAASTLVRGLSSGELDFERMDEICVDLCRRFNKEGVLGLDAELEGKCKNGGFKKRSGESDEGVHADGDEVPLEYIQYHSEMVKVVALLQVSYPEALMESIKPVSRYLVDCTSSPYLLIAASACMYWAGLGYHPIYSNPRCGAAWKSSFSAELPRLVSGLLSCMIYREAHAAYLEQCPSNGTTIASKETPIEPPSDEVSSYSDLRNLAALGFENISRAFDVAAVEAFQPFLVEMLSLKGSLDKVGGSKDEGGAHGRTSSKAGAASGSMRTWKEKDAAILALCALTKAIGLTPKLAGLHSRIVDIILDCYSDERPLLRSIACFAMPHFLGQQLGLDVSDPFPVAIERTLSLLIDPYIEVRCIAIRSLATMLAFVHVDVASHVDKIVDGLVQADAGMFGDCRAPYFECIGHLFGRVGTTLSSYNIDRLLSPLMTRWQQLQALEDDYFDEDEGNDDDDEEDVDVVTLCRALSMVAYHTGKGFAPHAEAIFSKASQQMRLVLDAYTAGEKARKDWDCLTNKNKGNKTSGEEASAGDVHKQCGDQSSGVSKEAEETVDGKTMSGKESSDEKEKLEMTGLVGKQLETGEGGVQPLPRDLVICYLVGCLDVLCAVYDGIGTEAARHSVTYHMPELIMEILSIPQFHECIHQSCLALLGHVARYSASNDVAPSRISSASSLPSRSSERKELRPSDFLDLVIEFMTKNGPSCIGDGPSCGSVDSLKVDGVGNLSIACGNKQGRERSGGKADMDGTKMKSSASPAKLDTGRDKCQRVMPDRKKSDQTLSSASSAKNVSGSNSKKQATLKAPASSDKPSCPVTSQPAELARAASPTRDMQRLTLRGQGCPSQECADSDSDSSASSGMLRLAHCEELYCNALWALIFISRDGSSSPSKLLGVINELIATLKEKKGHVGCVINAAWALTNICAARPDQTSAVILSRDVFLHIVGLLQHGFPRPELEQVEIFKNLVVMLAPVIERLEPIELWTQFLVAAATVVKLPDESLHKEIRTLLHDVKRALGGVKWARVMKDAGKTVDGIISQKYGLH